MIYGNSTATFSSKLRETTRLLRPRGRKFARARLSRSPGYLYVIRGDLQPSPAAFIAIIAPEVEVRDPRQPRLHARLPVTLQAQTASEPPTGKTSSRYPRGFSIRFSTSGRASLRAKDHHELRRFIFFFRRRCSWSR